MKRKGLLGNIITALLLLAVVAIVVARLAGVQFRAVISGSMEPEIPVGALVVGVPTKFENIREGDDIIFQLSNGKVVTHRVIEKNSEKQVVITQGIANNTADGEIAAADILGVVRFHANYIGYPSIFLESTVNKVIAGVVAAAVILIILVAGSPGKDKKKALGEVEFVSEEALELDDRFCVD